MGVFPVKFYRFSYKCVFVSGSEYIYFKAQGHMTSLFILLEPLYHCHTSRLINIINFLYFPFADNSPHVFSDNKIDKSYKIPKIMKNRHSKER